MRWEDFVKNNMVEKRSRDTELAKSLLNAAVERFGYFDSKDISIYALEGIYEAILELSHAVLATDGFKTLSHECSLEFLRGKFLSDQEIELLHKLRKKRHQSKYYGKTLSREALKAHIEIGRNREKPVLESSGKDQKNSLFQLIEMPHSAGLWPVLRHVCKQAKLI